MPLAPQGAGRPASRPAGRRRPGLAGKRVVLGLLAFIAVASAVMLPVLTTPAEPFKKPALEALWACPRAAELLGPKADPVFSLFPGVFQHGKAKTLVDGSGWAAWTMAVEGSLGRGTYRFRLRRLGGQWEIETGHLIVRGEALDVLACAGKKS